MKKESNRQVYIDSLKGLAALGVFFGHFYCIFYALCDYKPGLSEKITRLLNMPSPLSAWIDGQFMTCIFCVLSGYLVNLGSVKTGKEFGTKLLKRYLRFMLPLIGSNLIIFLLDFFKQFHTQEFGYLIGNSWLTCFYRDPVSFKSAIKDTLTLGYANNGPLWMLRPLFLGSCIVMLYGLLREKTKKRAVRFLYFAVVILLAFLLRKIFLPHLLFACYLGIFLNWLWNTRITFFAHLRESRMINVCILLFSILMSSGFHMMFYNYLSVKTAVPDWLSMNDYWHVFYAVLFLYPIKNLDFLQKVLEWKSFQKLGQLSFGIFVLHWPVICSFSLQFYLKNQGRASYSVLFVINWGVTTALVLLVSYIYYIVVERYSDRMIKNIKYL